MMLLPCPFRLLTGFDCPGCGSQRALLALLHGRVADAADHNLLVVVGVAALPVWLASPKMRVFFRRPAIRAALIVTVLAFWVARNVPMAPFRYLASGLGQ